MRGLRPLLMVCHTPPFETRCDRIVGGKAVGSTAARRFIEEVKPDVCISGHIHESAGVDTIGPTTVVQRGPVQGWRLYRGAQRRAAGSTRDWSFFEVPALSRVQQSAGVYYGKLVNGRSLVLKGWPALLRRFILGRL